MFLGTQRTVRAMSDSPPCAAGSFSSASGAHELLLMTHVGALLASESYTAICAYLSEHIGFENLGSKFLADVLVKIESSPRVHRVYPVGQFMMKKMLEASNMLFVVSEIMRNHGANRRIQENGCMVICYAFRSRLECIRTEDITPCATAIVIAMQTHAKVSSVQFAACCALHSIVLVGCTDGHYPFRHTEGQYVVVNLVHTAMFMPQLPKLKEKMGEACCAVLAILMSGCKSEQTVEDGKDAVESAGVSGNVHRIDRAVATAMSAFPENHLISLHGSRVLGFLAEEHLELFVEMETNIINVANAFMMDYTNNDRQEATAGALVNFIRNKANGKTSNMNQKKVGVTGVISLAICALRNHYESNSMKGDVTKIMYTLLDLLHSLALDCLENQERILFTQTPALLLGIAKMHRRSADTRIETIALRLLCMLRVNANQDRIIDAAWPYELATWNKKIESTTGGNLLDMIVPAMQKVKASSFLVLDGLRLLCACVDDLTNASRSEEINANVLTVAMKLMVSRKPCPDEVAVLVVELLEKLSHHAVFALNPDMMIALRVPIPPSLAANVQHYQTRYKATQQIEVHMQA